LSSEEIIDSRGWLENHKNSLDRIDIRIVEKLTRSDSCAIEDVFVGQR